MPTSATELVLLASAISLLAVRNRQGRAVRPSSRRCVAFLAGQLLAIVALLPPVEAGATRFFAVHMLQHFVLLAGATPLMAWSGLWDVVARRLPPLDRTELAMASAALLTVSILVWHLPFAHDWAVQSETARFVEHCNIIGAGIGFWRLIVFSETVSPVVRAIIVWLVSIQSVLLSAILIFAPVQLCISYRGNPLIDQVLAGLIMCIPMSLIYAATTIWSLTLLLKDRTAGGSSSQRRSARPL